MQLKDSRECAIRIRHSPEFTMNQIADRIGDFLQGEFKGKAYVKNVHYVERPPQEDDHGR